jgi:O-acetyl-ADP-ribose deacetylase (regulator of RNase III)
MKLVFRQYLASLKERKELDAVLPDLLSELGYTVISRPTIGTRQYGVDVAAVG